MSDNDFDPERYDADQSFVVEYGRDLLDLLDPQPGERTLDVGCGTGHLTADIAEVTGDVVGIDADAAMVERARETYPDLTFRVADVTTFAPERPFDAAFSNAALHWIPAPQQDDALAAVADALAPGGRFVAEMGASGNVTEILDAAHVELSDRGYETTTPWYFPTLGTYAGRLESVGFTVELARTFERETTLSGPDGLRSWLGQFGDGLLPEGEERAAVVDGIERRLRPSCYDETDKSWTVTYRRLQFRARNAGE